MSVMTLMVFQKNFPKKLILKKMSRQQSMHVVEGSSKHNWIVVYSKTCVKQPLSKRPKIGFHNQLSLNAGQSIAECCNTLDLH